EHHPAARREYAAQVRQDARVMLALDVKQRVPADDAVVPAGERPVLDARVNPGLPGKAFTRERQQRLRLVDPRHVVALADHELRHRAPVPAADIENGGWNGAPLEECLEVVAFASREAGTRLAPLPGDAVV